MSSGVSRIRADHDQLRQISLNFERQANSSRQTLDNLRRNMETLEQGDWIGKGATAFYQEMRSSVLPAVQRLVSSLEQAQRVTQQISQVMQQVESEASGLFRGDGSGGGVLGGMASAINSALGDSGGAGGSGGTSGGSGGSSGGASGGTSGGSSGGAGSGGTSGGSGNPLVANDPANVFNDSYFRSLKGNTDNLPGADSSQLRNAMNALARNPTGAELDRTLQQIADARGRPVSEIRQEYDRFLQLRQQAQEFGARNGQEMPPALSGIHSDFMGSTSQLRYGKVVGDVLGVDPVFASMLNPTGGMVGPGNAAFDADATAVGMHGIVHDAAGYLYNFHNTGPGYDYLGREGRNTADPLSGQREGIRYWREITPGVNPGSTAAEYVMRGVVPVADAYNWVSDKFSRLRNIF
jgi:WXG100 family type VII secretion target